MDGACDNADGANTCSIWTKRPDPRRTGITVVQKGLHVGLSRNHVDIELLQVSVQPNSS